jgi:hypothetical protein
MGGNKGLTLQDAAKHCKAQQHQYIGAILLDLDK